MPESRTYRPQILAAGLIALAVGVAVTLVSSPWWGILLGGVSYLLAREDIESFEVSLDLIALYGALTFVRHSAGFAGDHLEFFTAPTVALLLLGLVYVVSGRKLGLADILIVPLSVFGCDLQALFAGLLLSSLLALLYVSLRALTRDERFLGVRVAFVPFLLVGMEGGKFLGPRIYALMESAVF